MYRKVYVKNHPRPWQIVCPSGFVMATSATWNPGMQNKLDRWNIAYRRGLEDGRREARQEFQRKEMSRV